MTRAIIYARVSSEEQAGEGKTSIPTQIADCRQLAARLGWTVVGEFIDDRRYRVGKRLVEPSGTRADRPQWRRLLAELEQGRADALLAWHSTRLYRAYRPMIDLLDILDARPVQVQLVKDSFDPKFAILQAWLGREENAAKVERTRFGHIGRANKGLTATHTTPYYKPIRDPDSGRSLGYEFNETYRVHFDAMARLFLQRTSYRNIHVALGINPRTGRAWGPETIRCILNNPFYRGVVEFGRRARKDVEVFRQPGLHKAVWDAETCAAIEIELARRAALGSHAPRSRVAPFAGLLRCGYCGHMMSPASPAGRVGRDGKPYRSYSCYYNKEVRIGVHPGTIHPSNGIAERRLIRMIQAMVADFSAADMETEIAALAAAVPSAPVDNSQARLELAALEEQIIELEPELGRVRSAVARGAIDAELTRLREQAELFRTHLRVTSVPQTVDLAAMRAGWSRLVDAPQLLTDLSDTDLKLFMGQIIPVLYIAGGAIVPPPQL